MVDVSTIKTKEDFDNHFKVGSHALGRGGFGYVYPVLDKDFYTVAAVKQIEKTKHNGNEIEILKMCKGQVNIVEYFFDFETETQIWIGMEFCDTDLSTRIRANVEKCFPADVIFAWFGQLLCGLEYLHENHIIHRNITPNNILLKEVQGRREVLKISGFSCSKILKPNETLNNLAGTMSQYMSPQVYGKKDYTFKTDVWSLGVLFLEIVTRKVRELLPEDTTYFTQLDESTIPKFTETIPGERLSNDINDLLKFINGKMIVKEEKDRVSLKEVIDHDLFKKHYGKCKEENSRLSIQETA